MCDPVSITLAVVGAAVSAAQAGISAKASKDEANYQSQVAENNALIASQQRSAALQQGEVDASNAMTQIAQTTGKQRAALSANGVDITQGSALDQLASTSFMGQSDINTLQSNAAREAWGYDVQKTNYMADAALSEHKAKNTNPALIGALAGTSSLLNSATPYAADIDKFRSKKTI